MHIGKDSRLDSSEPPVSVMSTSTDTGNVENGVTERKTASITRDDGEQTGSGIFEKSCILIPENEIEAHRISNNYMFGFKKWKSHVSSRPLSTRSEIVQDLYADINKIRPVVSTLRPFNILYAVLFGWWLALVYVIISGLMYVTFIGRSYGKLCWKMAGYFFWPFGKFVHHIYDIPLHSVARTSYRDVKYANHNNGITKEPTSETTTLLGSDKAETNSVKRSIWVRPQTYIWFVFGLPVIFIVHAVIAFITWLLIISIPIAKLNIKTITSILFLPPEEVDVKNSSETALDSAKSHSEIIMFTHQAINIYYYKYTVDGVNIILVNLLVFVLLSLALGYSDPDNNITSGVTKCILGVLAIVPLTYYIGMAITSISAQSSFAVGAILNATFGSMVEIILFIVVLNKGKDTGKECFQELVKSSLAGTILVSILFIPGVCMVVGGIKYRMQKFNPKSAGVSAALLFVSIAGVFAPTVFAKLYGDLQCKHCEQEVKELDIVNASDLNGADANITYGFKCTSCTQTVVGLNGDLSLYKQHVEPLIYSCALVLPIAYVVGLIFTLKTHSSHVYGAFEEQLKTEVANAGGHGSAQWNRIKSGVILLLCAVLIALCADLITDNIQPLLEASGISEYFVGATMLALVPELPEVVNGIQFALQNNVNLGIEIGSSTAIQVCLVQVPLLVLINLIYPLGFVLIFQDVHLFAVIFSVIVINYIFQDGKSDYFQGSIVVLIYLVLMLMYFFTITAPEAKC